MRKIFNVTVVLAFILLFCVGITVSAYDVNKDTCTVLNATVKKGTPIVDGVLDRLYTDSFTVRIHGPASSYFISANSCEDTTATGTVYATYDDSFLYMFVHVVDNTLIKGDEGYINVSWIPRLSDSVEIWISDDLNDHFTYASPYMHIFADGHGMRFSGCDRRTDKGLENSKYAHILGVDKKNYYLEMAVPIQKPFEVGEIIELNVSINDIQDNMDSYCAVGMCKRDVLTEFEIGGAAVVPMIAAEDTALVKGGTVDIPIMLTGNDGIAGLGLSVEYSECLELVEVKRGDGLKNLDFTVIEPYSYPLCLLWDGVEADTSNGTVAILTFKVKEDALYGDYNVDVNVTDAYDNNLKDILLDNVRSTVHYREYLSGDINGDNAVDLKDVTALRRHMAEGYDVRVNEAALDVNRDGDIDLKDVTFLRRCLAGGYGVSLY